MSEIRHGPRYVVPVLRLGATRRVLFPEEGEDTLFTIYNVAYEDKFGRETVAWAREFALSPPRRFDATMIYSERRGGIVDYLDTHQNVAVDIHPTVTDDGGLHLRSRAQRLYVGRFGVGVPRVLSGFADVVERYDETEDRFEVEVTVHNPLVGTLFSYDGWFEVEWRPQNAVPDDVRPVWEERRE